MNTLESAINILSKMWYAKCAWVVFVDYMVMSILLRQLSGVTKYHAISVSGIVETKIALTKRESRLHEKT